MICMVKENIIIQQIQHWIAKVSVRVIDNRKTECDMDYNATEVYTVFFELDGEGYSSEDKTYEIKGKVIQILKELGYTWCGIIDTDLQSIEYDAETAISK